MDSLPPQYGDFVADPYTGLMVPKRMELNLAWRKKLVADAKGSRSLQKQLRTASSNSPVFFINAFLWTYHQKKVAASGVGEQAVYGDLSNVPFITWRVQDEALATLIDAIDNGKDGLIRKSRDMGASWLVLAVIQWYFQFRANTTFLEISRKEKLVDQPGDMDSLFEKHRYMLKWQPDWLRPSVNDKRMHLENRDNGSSITGESTNENAGQASRKTMVFLDEFARIPNGNEIDLATKDTTACRIFNSTPGGPATAHTRIYREIKNGSRLGTLIELPWWRHPDKGRDAKQVPDAQGKLVWTNPWYEDQVKRRSKKDVAQNLDMEFGRAGDSFFVPDEIEKHRAAFQAAPLSAGNIPWVDDHRSTDETAVLVRKQNPDAVFWSDGSTHKPWRLWVPLVKDDKGRMRPNQQTRYVFGIDVSAGTGASNSVVSVLDHRTGMIVGKFWDAFTSPEELAEVAARAGMFFGGIKPPLVVFEKNGPGGIFGKRLLTLGYPNIYFQRVDNDRRQKQTPRWGWTSSNSRKEMMLGDYRSALKQAEVINPCEQALDEALDYVYDATGRVEPGNMGSEDGGGNALHGDHVIADGLVVLGRKELPKIEPDKPVRPPAGSYEDRRRQRKKAERDKEVWSR